MDAPAPAAPLRTPPENSPTAKGRWFAVPSTSLALFLPVWFLATHLLPLILAWNRILVNGERTIACMLAFWPVAGAVLGMRLRRPVLGLIFGAQLCALASAWFTWQLSGQVTPNAIIESMFANAALAALACGLLIPGLVVAARRVNESPRPATWQVLRSAAWRSARKTAIIAGAIYLVTLLLTTIIAWQQNAMSIAYNVALFGFCTVAVFGLACFIWTAFLVAASNRRPLTRSRLIAHLAIAIAAMAGCALVVRSNSLYRNYVAVANLKAANATLDQYTGAGDTWLKRQLNHYFPRTFRVVVGQPKFDPSGLRYVADLAGDQSVYFLIDFQDQWLEELGPAENVESITFGDYTGLGVDVTDDGLARLAQFKNLASLDCCFTRVTGRGLGELAGLEHLRHLMLIGNPIDDEGVRNLGKLAHLESLHLVGRFGDQSLSHLGNLKQLTRLTIRSKQVTGEGLRFLESLPELDSLTLQCPITDEALRHLASCASLSELEIDAPIRGAGLRYLTRLPKLTKLELRNNEIDDAGLLQLVNLSSDTNLRLGKPRRFTMHGVATMHRLRVRATLDEGYGVRGDFVASLDGRGDDMESSADDEAENEKPETPNQPDDCVCSDEDSTTSELDREEARIDRLKELYGLEDDRDVTGGDLEYDQAPSGADRGRATDQSDTEGLHPSVPDC
jgi:hypothetical protein